MFQLHDRTRRRLTLLLFYVLCVAPTLVVSGWCLAHRLPGRVRAEEVRLGWQLGLKVSLDAIRTPRPGVTRYEGLVLSAPEDGSPILRCGAVEAQWAKDDSQAVLQLTAIQPIEVESAKFDELWRLADQLLTYRVGGPELRVRWSAGEVGLRGTGERVSLADVRGSFGTVAKTGPNKKPTAVTLAEIRFRPSTSKPEDETVFSAWRRREAEPTTTARPRTEFALETGPSPLPCSLLTAIRGPLPGVGSQSHFKGRLDGQECPEGWAYRWKGRVFEIDLASLIAERSTQPRLTGIAEVIDVDDAVHRNGRLESFSGRLMAREGAIRRELVESAELRLGLQANLSDGDRGEISYDLLKVELSLDARGVVLTGLFRDGGVVRAGNETLLYGQRSRLAPLSAFVRTLTSESEEDAGELLAQRLPVPAIAPSERRAGYDPAVMPSSFEQPHEK